WRSFPGRADPPESTGSPARAVRTPFALETIQEFSLAREVLRLCSQDPPAARNAIYRCAAPPQWTHRQTTAPNIRGASLGSAAFRPHLNRAPAPCPGQRHHLKGLAA